MGIGAGIFLIAVGLILALGVHAQVSGLDIAVIGYILVAVGVLGLALTVFVFAPRRRSSSVVETRRTDGAVAPVAGETVTREVRDDSL